MRQRVTSKSYYKGKIALLWFTVSNLACLQTCSIMSDGAER